MRVDRRRSRTRGDTLIELMAALTIATIGVLGLGSMQSGVAHSSRDAEEVGAALRFARTWLERIKRDALAWNAPGSPILTQITAGRTSSDTYFVPMWPETAWFVPVPMGTPTVGGFTGPVESSAANLRGIDVGARDYAAGRVVTQADAHFCALARFTSIQVNAGRVEAMRAVVRVWWTRVLMSPGDSNYRSIISAKQSGCSTRTNNEFGRDIRFVEVDYPITYTSNGS